MNVTLLVEVGEGGEEAAARAPAAAALTVMALLNENTGAGVSSNAAAAAAASPLISITKQGSVSAPFGGGFFSLSGVFSLSPAAKLSQTSPFLLHCTAALGNVSVSHYLAPAFNGVAVSFEATGCTPRLLLSGKGALGLAAALDAVGYTPPPLFLAAEEVGGVFDLVTCGVLLPSGPFFGSDSMMLGSGNPSAVAASTAETTLLIRLLPRAASPLRLSFQTAPVSVAFGSTSLLPPLLFLVETGRSSSVHGNDSELIPLPPLPWSPPPTCTSPAASSFAALRAPLPPSPSLTVLFSVAKGHGGFTLGRRQERGVTDHVFVFSGGSSARLLGTAESITASLARGDLLLLAPPAPPGAGGITGSTVEVTAWDGGFRVSTQLHVEWTAVAVGGNDAATSSSGSGAYPVNMPIYALSNLFTVQTGLAVGGGLFAARFPPSSYINSTANSSASISLMLRPRHGVLCGYPLRNVAIDSRASVSTPATSRPISDHIETAEPICYTALALRFPSIFHLACAFPLSIVDGIYFFNDTTSSAACSEAGWGEEHTQLLYTTVLASDWGSDSVTVEDGENGAAEIANIWVPPPHTRSPILGCRQRCQRIFFFAPPCPRPYPVCGCGAACESA